MNDNDNFSIQGAAIRYTDKWFEQVMKAYLRLVEQRKAAELNNNDKNGVKKDGY